MPRTLLALLLLAAPAAALEWLPLSDARFALDGLPWSREAGGQLHRFPPRLKEAVTPAVWNLSLSPTGGRIRFRTDSNQLAIRLEYPGPPDMANMHAFGQTGVDLYLDGVYRGTAIAAKDSGPGKPVEKLYFDLGDRPRRLRDVVLYLPLYKPVTVLGIGVGAEAKFEPARPYALPKPVVFYGTSITQGGCASRPGLAYQAILGRRLDLDFVNLGFSGNGKGEPALARALGELDAAAIVLDYSQNNRTLESLREVYEPFLAVLREKHPRTPVIAITPIAQAAEQLTEPLPLEAMRAHIRQVVSARIGAGDRHLYLVEGTDLIGSDRLDGFVDGTHPNDLGFQWMADGLAPRLAQLLLQNARAR